VVGQKQLLGVQGDVSLNSVSGQSVAQGAEPIPHVTGSVPTGACKVLPPVEVRSQIAQPVTRDLGLERVDHQEMVRWRWDTRIFTHSSYCNPLTGLPSVSFENTDCCGQHTWLDPPPNRIESALAHYVACKKKDPMNTSACILVPRYEGGSHWRRHLQGMRLLHEYPAGTPLKFACNPPLRTEEDFFPLRPVKPSKYPLQLWYDPQLGADPAKLAGQVIQAYFPGDSEPRKRKQGHNIKAVAADAWMMFQGRVGQEQCNILLDTGATANFISQGLAKQLSATIRACRQAPVHTVGGRVTILGTCQPRVCIQGHKSSPLCLVLPDLLLDYGLVLGKPWLVQHKVHVQCETGQCTVEHKGKRITLTPVSAEDIEEAPVEPAAASAQQPCPTEWEDDRLSEARLVSADRLAKEWHKVPGARLFAMTLHPSELAAVGKDIPPEPDVPPELREIIREYAAVFEEIPDGLPPYRGEPHVIELLPEAQPPRQIMSRLTPKERVELEKQVAWLLKKGFISESNSPYGSPVLFVIKPSGEYRMCVDYRGVNKISVKSRYPLPRIDDLLDRLQGASVFSNLDLQAGYHQLLISEADRPKTAFLTPIGLFEYNVLSFGLCNAAGTFMRVMNKVFQGCQAYVVVYMDDICIFSANMREHQEHLRAVLQKLKEARLYAKLSKCTFGQSQLKFLGYIITKEGIRADPKKVEALQTWPVPDGVKKLRSFLGLATYFKKQIQHFAEIAHPLNVLLRKDRLWKWDKPCQQAFDSLKQRMVTAPVLALPDLRPGAPVFKVYCDASLIAIGAVLTQGGRPIAYESRRMLPAECNYTTTEQELLAVVHSLRLWRCYLDGAKFVVVTDHCPLTYLQTKASLSRRQVRWAGELQNYDFTWEYTPGKNNPADALSRLMALRCGDADLVDCLLTQQEQAQRTRMSSLRLMPMVTRSRAQAPAPPVPQSEAQVPQPDTDMPDVRRAPVTLSQLQQDCAQGYEQDSWFRQPDNTATLQMSQEGIWMREGKVCVPQAGDLRDRILAEVHDTPYGAHQGVQRTFEQINRMFWWPTMRGDVREYVTTCSACQANKASRQRPAGLLQSTPIPERRWDGVSLDFITQLPLTKGGNTQIVVYVDRLTKMCHLEALPTDADALRVARSFVQNVFRLHGLPSHLLSDRDTKFTATVWQEVMALLGTKLGMTTAYHAQGDGQTERMNQVLEDMLRQWVNPRQDNWDELLAVAEFAINNSMSATVKDTPFRLNAGQDPHTPLSIELRHNSPVAGEFVSRMKQALISAKQAIEQAQVRQKDAYDARHRPQDFEIGDLVLLKTTNLQFKGRVSRKLMPKWVGPYAVLAKAGTVSYKLKLPDNMRIHPVFHTSLLKPWKSSERHQVPPAPVEVEGEEEYEVEEVLRHEPARGGKKKYLIKWVGYGPEYNEWKSEEELSHCADLVKAYWNRLPAQLPG